jgi:hypothetical protein
MALSVVSKISFCFAARNYEDRERQEGEGEDRGGAKDEPSFVSLLDSF